MPQNRHVTHASFSRLGGAGAVAERLAAGQCRLGWRAEVVALVETPYPRWGLRHPVIALAALLDYYLVRRAANGAFFSLFRRQHARRVVRRLAAAEDILHLHWLPGFVRPDRLVDLPLRCRTLVWSVQDMWPLTGGCHYAHACQGFHGTCANCPQVRPCFRAGVAAAFRRKCAGLRRRRDVRIVVPSEWTRTHVEASAATRGLRTWVIPNPVDTARFAPGDRDQLRAKWGFPPEAFVVGVGAADLRDARKQIWPTLRTLREWAASHRARARIHALVFGAGSPPRGFPGAFRFVGPSPSADILSEWYNIMDVYVTLSRYETFGNTLAEAAACAIPAVCLTGSGTAEVVVDGQSGHHVAGGDQLVRVLSDGVADVARLRAMGRTARALATQRFDLDVVARQFVHVYASDDPPPPRLPAREAATDMGPP